MPITSFEVGTVFKVIDQASRVIARITKGVTDLNDKIEWAQLNLSKLGNKNFDRVTANLKKVTDQVEAMTASIDGSVVAMTGAADASAIVARNMAAAARSAAAMGRSASSAVASGVAGTVGGRGGMSIGRRGTALGGGFHAHGGGLVGQGMLASLLYGGYEQAGLNDASFRAIFTAGIGGNAQNTVRMSQFRNIVKAASAKTGESIGDVSSAALNEIRLLGAGVSWDEKMKVLPQILQIAAAEGRLKDMAMPESAASFVELAHMTRTYDPSGIAKLASRFGFLSTMVDAPINRMTRAFGYNVPQLTNKQTGAGYDQWQVMMLDTMLMQAGIMNTKSGTWIRELGLRALPGTTAQSKTAFIKHEAALARLGLIDAHGKPTFMGPDGNPDIVKMLQIAGPRIAALNPGERAGIEKQLFGAQGAGAFAVLSNPVLLQQLPKVAAMMQNYDLGGDFFSQFADASQKQQFLQTWRQFTNVMMDLANTVLPAFSTQMKNLNSIFSVIDTATGGIGAGKLAGGALIGAVAGFMIGGTPGAAVGAAIGAALGIDWGAGGSAVKNQVGKNLSSGNNPLMGLVPGAGGLVLPGQTQHWTTDDIQEALTHKKALNAQKENTEQLKKLNDMLRGFAPASYYGGATLQPAMFTTGGGFGTTSAAAMGPMTSNPGAYPMMGALKHFTIGDIAALSGGANAAAFNTNLGGLTGSAFYKGLRSPFAKELSDPNKRLQFAAMLLSEGNPLQTAESAMNRSNFQNKTLMQALHSGFYGPINRGQLPRFMAQLSRNPKLMAKMNAAINSALAGSDTIKGSTDQGLVSDPNGSYILHHFHVWGAGHGNIYGDWNGGRGTEAWRHWAEGHAGGDDNASASDAIPSGGPNNNIHVHTRVDLDGHKVGKIVTKHQAKMGNMPSHSGRLPDFTGTRPPLLQTI